MSSGLRLAIAIPLGIFTGVLVTAIVEHVSHRLWPLPLGHDAGDPLAVQAYVDSLPAASLGLVLSGWVLAVLAGFASSVLVARESHRTLAIVMGATFTAVALQTFALVSHPVWFVALSLVALPATTAATVAVAAIVLRPAWLRFAPGQPGAEEPQ